MPAHKFTILEILEISRQATIFYGNSAFCSRIRNEVCFPSQYVLLEERYSTSIYVEWERTGSACKIAYHFDGSPSSDLLIYYIHFQLIVTYLRALFSNPIFQLKELYGSVSADASGALEE